MLNWILIIIALARTIYKSSIKKQKYKFKYSFNLIFLGDKKITSEWDQVKTTTIRLNEKLWNEVKIEAIKHKMTAGEIVEDGIRLWLKQNKAEEKQERK
jgi:hypothetical protein